MGWRRIVLVVVAVLVVGLGGGLVYARPLLLTGTGYAAHNACAVRFVAGRGPEAPDADLPPNPLVPYLRTTVSEQDRTATSSVLGLLFRQTARHAAGSGCTLSEDPVAGSAASPSTASDQRSDPAAPPDESSSPLPEGTVTPSTAAALDDALEAAFGEDGALGTRAVIVVHRGRVVAERYAAGFGPQTPQLGWSMAKSVTSLLTGRLVEQGKLALTEDRLRPEWTDQRASITLDQLLRMSSGLEWDETYALGTPITRMLYLEDDMAGYAASLPLAHEPGSYQQYSSGTTNILCSVLHQRSGLGTDLAERLLFDSLGISSAVWEPDATGHLTCSSYLWATPRDWAAIGQFALQDGHWDGTALLPPDWMRTTTTPVAIAGEEDGTFAAHWWANRRPDGTLALPSLPADTYWASGHDGQRVMVIPSRQSVIVRMGFTPEGDTGIGSWGAEVVRALATEPAG